MAQETQKNDPTAEPSQASQSQDSPQQTQPQQPEQPPQAEQPQQPPQAEQPQPQQVEQQVTQPAETCPCPEINTAEWDKQKKQIAKTFYKTFSPRILNYPFSYVIDVDRASRGARAKNYEVPENPMILDTGGMFWGELMVEVTGADTSDSNVVDLTGKDLYTKTTTDTKSIKNEMEGLKAEMGVEPSEVYYWRTTCPKCDSGKELKAIVIAVVPQAQQTQQPAEQTPPAATPPPAPPAPTEPQQAAEEPKAEQPAEEPKQEQPAEEPKQEQPAEEPKAEQPAEEPKPEQPTPPAEEPKQEQPAEEPKAEQPAEEPKPEQPTPPAEEPKEEKPPQPPQQ